jgi:hypothetical protein
MSAAVILSLTLLSAQTTAAEWQPVFDKDGIWMATDGDRAVTIGFGWDAQGRNAMMLNAHETRGIGTHARRTTWAYRGTYGRPRAVDGDLVVPCTLRTLTVKENGRTLGERHLDKAVELLILRPAAGPRNARELRVSYWSGGRGTLGCWDPSPHRRETDASTSNALRFFFYPR